MTDPPEPARRRTVVGAAVIRDGLLLAACRRDPPELAGRWELPGGKVEPDESEAGALRRECHEELGVRVSVWERIGPDLPIPPGTLRVYRCTLAPGSSQPAALVHAEVRWVDAVELAALHWLEADRALLPALIEALGRPEIGRWHP